MRWGCRRHYHNIYNEVTNITLCVLESFFGDLKLNLISRISLNSLLDKMEKQLGLGVNRHRPILIEQAAEILQMKTGTVRRLVNDRAIPHYKREHNIYFFEDELIKWVEDSKVKLISYTSSYRK